MISHAYLLTHKDILRICCRFVGFHWLIGSAIFDFRLNQRKRYIFSSIHFKKLTLVFGRTGILMENEVRLQCVICTVDRLFSPLVFCCVYPIQS